MSLFLSTFTNKVDKKGRVSIPASFRKVLFGENQSCISLISYGSFLHDCIECCTVGKVEKMASELESMDFFSEERDAFAMTILGGCMELIIDPEGRVKLPDMLLEIADITEKASFVGKGGKFEIWNPSILKDHIIKSREIARKRRMIFGRLRNRVYEG